MPGSGPISAREPKELNGSAPANAPSGEVSGGTSGKGLAPPTEVVRILVLRRAPDDGDAIEQALRSAGISFTAEGVETQGALIEALDAFAPDIVLIDCNLSNAEGLTAIRRMRERSEEPPVILITEGLGDQAAVELIKAGAYDYIRKDALARLPTAVQRALAEARAIRARRRAEENLRLSEERYRSLVVAIAQIVWTTNANGEVTEDLPTWRAFTGQGAKEIEGAGWLAALHPDDREQTAAAWSASVRSGTLLETEYRLRRRDGQYRCFSARGVPVMKTDGTIREWVGVCTDITERKLHEEQLAAVNARMIEALRAQAVRDPLTGLFNRQYLDETLMREVRRGGRRKTPFSVVMLDIDHFKNFNDSYGHAAGDEVLKELGRLLRTTVRGSDIACRYGGEEFVVVLLDADLAASLPSVERICRDIKRKRCMYRGQMLPGITMSAGIAQYPVHGRTGDDLLRAADEALYTAKNAGRDRVEISSARPGQAGATAEASGGERE